MIMNSTIGNQWPEKISESVSVIYMDGLREEIIRACKEYTESAPFSLLNNGLWWEHLDPDGAIITQHDMDKNQYGCYIPVPPNTINKEKLPPSVTVAFIARLRLKDSGFVVCTTDITFNVKYKWAKNKFEYSPIRLSGEHLVEEQNDNHADEASPE